MKVAIRPICLAVACLTALAPQLASAQSTNTLYGRAVSGIAYVDKVFDPVTNTTGSKLRIADSQWGTSMFGVRGTEDLGGGLAAHYVLEGGLSLKSGSTGAAFFNRRSHVGLSGAWGSFRAGKNLNISNDVWFLDPTGQQFAGSATLVRGRSWQGANNMIEYSTPTFGGFGATAQLALGEVAGNSKANRSEGLSLSYQAQDFELRAIHTARRGTAGTFDDVYNFSKETIVGGTYRFGPAKVFAAYDRITAPGAAATAASKLDHAWLGVRYDVTPALTLIGAGFHVKADRVDGKATLFMAGAEYALSKRTLLYASVGGVNNSGGGNFEAEIYAGNPRVNGSQRTVYAGIAHSF